MPKPAGWFALAVLLLYAAIELWSHVLRTDEAGGDTR